MGLYMRVLILTDKDLVKATKGGPDVLSVWRILRERGIESERRPASALPWNPFGGGAMALRGLDPLRAMGLLFRQKKYDLIIGVFEGSTVGPAFLRRFGLLRCPLIMWDFAVGTDWRLRQRFQDMVFRGIDGVLCLNGPQQIVAAERLRHRENAVKVGYDVDEEFFHPRFSSEGHYALAVGNDTSRDYITLLKSLEPESLPLTICTKRPLEIPLAVVGRVHKIDSDLSYSELRSLYAGAKFVVLPLKNALHPGGITTLVEAMSMGKAVVCSDSAGIREFITNGDNALMVPVGDHNAMREVIRRLDRDASERKRLGINARRYVESELSIGAFASRLAGALQHFGRL